MSQTDTDALSKSMICISINVGINHMSGLAVHNIPQYTGPSMTNSERSVFTPSRNPNVAKWDMLFDKKIAEWISFKPRLGLQVYPCYACRDMFGSKNSFLDHVNRRGMLLKYKCSFCPHSEVLLFYNPCSLLLHTRQHYNLLSGQINLENLEVCLLPYGLGGFLPDPSIPMLYNVEDDNLGETIFINARFYSPLPQSMGHPVVNLLPNELMFFSTAEANAPPTSLILKQISSNIPRCQFIPLDNNRFQPIPNGITQKELTLAETNNITTANGIQIKEEPEEIADPIATIQYNMPIITKIETLDEADNETNQPSAINSRSANENIENFPRCPECRQVQTISMGEHFLKTDNPFQESLKCPICKYIAPTKCSLQAHERIHESIAPYVCPECGKDFEDWEQLHAHLEEVCFHLTKQVRLRCPGKKCGKIFAQIVTFSAHFLAHMQCLSKCGICDHLFYSEEDFLDHNLIHEDKQLPIKLYICTVCSDINETYTVSNFQEHIYGHATSLKQCLYVYTCKRCHSYFRSTLTYATHLLRCSKPLPLTNVLIHTKSISAEVKQKRPTTVLQLLGICLTCKTQIRIQVQHYNNAPVNCPNCGNPLTYKDSFKTSTTNTLLKPHTTNNYSLKHLMVNRKSIAANEVCSCLLCNKKLNLNDMNDHFGAKKCKFQTSVVVLNPNTITNYFASKSSPKSDENAKKKRKRMPNNKFRKRSTSNSETDLSMEADEPIPFDGTYHCKLCDFSDTSREQFHEHIILHRDVRTAYQCMECGECFVVKPSLTKHLMYYHQVTNIDIYFNENNCFNKEAVKELENIMRLAPGESKEPVAENQCRVCLLKFSDAVELSKHFRIHGMAFLLKNSK